MLRRRRWCRWRGLHVHDSGVLRGRGEDADDAADDHQRRAACDSQPDPDPIAVAGSHHQLRRQQVDTLSCLPGQPVKAILQLSHAVSSSET
jgi:hypothetical protein